MILTVPLTDYQAIRWRNGAPITLNPAAQDGTLSHEGVPDGWQIATEPNGQTFLSPDPPEPSRKPPYNDPCRCWNEGQWGRVHREDCPIHAKGPA